MIGLVLSLLLATPTTLVFFFFFFFFKYFLIKAFLTFTDKIEIKKEKKKNTKLNKAITAISYLAYKLQ